MIGWDNDGWGVFCDDCLRAEDKRRYKFAGWARHREKELKGDNETYQCSTCKRQILIQFPE